MSGRLRTLLIVCHDCPYPPWHGGRVDMFQRIGRLIEEGFRVAVIGWTPHQEEVSLMVEYYSKIAVPAICLHTRSQWMRKLVRHPLLPVPCATHSLIGEDAGSVGKWLETFDCGLVLADGLWAAPMALKIARRFSVPLLYRSHNVEYQYRRKLGQAGSWKQRLVEEIDWRRVRWVEREIRTSAVQVFDIATEDSREWPGNRSMTLVPWLPESKRRSEHAVAKYDIGYIGNLNSPNNVEALAWFASVTAGRLVGARILFAGSRPSEKVYELARKCGADVLANPPDIDAVYASVRVLVNPVQRGSGVNIKTLEMALSNKPIVVTTAAVRGAPEALIAYLQPTDSAESFVERLETVLTADNSADLARQRALLLRSEMDQSFRNFTSYITDLGSLKVA